MIEVSSTQPANAFHEAVAELEAKGMTVEPAEIPGLIFVDGRELTMGQVFDLARQSRFR